GGRLAALGDPVDPATLLAVEEPRPSVAPGSVRAAVVAVDGFGNVQLAADGDALEASGLRPGAPLTVTAGPTAADAVLAEPFGAVPAGELVVLIDSAGSLAVARNRGDAAACLRVAPGDWIWISQRAS